VTPEEEVNANVAGRTPEAQASASFVAKSIKSSSKRGNIEEQQLSDRISEIEEETTIKGTDYLKVKIIDPDWTLQTSGFVDVDKEGLLDPIEIEFPAASKRMWVLCAVEGSTEVSEANFIMTFQDKLFTKLASKWGIKPVPPGTETRAAFVNDLLVEAGVPGVIPGIGILQPVEEEKKGELGQTVIETTIQAQNAHAKTNKTPGVTAGSAITVKGATPDTEQTANINTVLSVARQLGAEQLPLEALIEACITENTFHNTGEGILQVIPSTAAGLGISDTDIAACVTAFLEKGFGGQGGAIAYARAHPKAQAYEVAQAVQASGAGAASKGAANYGQTSPTNTPQEARNIIQEGGGAATGEAVETTSDVGQLKRGTDANPDENSAECIERLAQQVDWAAFSNGLRFYYMTQPELAGQRPALYVDIPGNHVVTPAGKSEYGVVLSPTTYSLDDTAFEYRRTHKLKQRTQRRSKTTRPSSPSEVKLDLICRIGQYVAGEVIAFRHSGPVSSIGKWLVVQTVRKCMKDVYTEILCEPPVEPLPEPKESSKEEIPASETGGVGGASEQAKKALEERSKYEYSEGANRENNGTLFGQAPRTMDCSSFVTLCYKASSLPDPSNKNYHPIGDTSTLIANCEKVENPTKDDLCFFGPSESETVHVTIYVGGGNAIAMQAPGITLGEGPAKTFGPGNFLGFYRPKNY
jgi:NlpC/P60 family protein